MKLGLKGGGSADMNIKACVDSLAKGRPEVCVLICEYSVHHSFICRFTQSPLAIPVYRRSASTYEEGSQKKMLPGILLGALCQLLSGGKAADGGERLLRV